MNKDLTKGNPTKVLLLYSLPLFGSIIFQQLYTIADSFVAGHFINTNALAAVGNSYEITLIYIAFAFGCNIGTSVIAARYFGTKDYKNVKTASYTSLIASTIIGIILIVLGIFLAGPLLQLTHTPANIFADSKSYLLIYLVGFVFLLIYNIATGIYSALGDSRTPFIFLAISSVTNIGVDILFVKTFKMGVNGVAWATFLCQGISGIVALICILKRLKKLESTEKAKCFDWKILREISGIAIPSILQQSFISVGNIVIQSQINMFGASAIGGYAASVKLNNLTITSITAMGNGISNYTAQNYGAGIPDRIKKGMKDSSIIVLVIAIIFTILYLACGKTFVKLFITDNNLKAIDTGVVFLQVVAPFYCVIAIKLMADGILRGINKMGYFMFATFTDLIIRVICSITFAKTIGLNGIWWSWPIGWAVATIVSLFFYFKVKKKKFYIKDKTPNSTLIDSKTAEEIE